MTLGSCYHKAQVYVNQRSPNKTISMEWLDKILVWMSGSSLRPNCCISLWSVIVNPSLTGQSYSIYSTNTTLITLSHYKLFRLCSALARSYIFWCIIHPNARRLHSIMNSIFLFTRPWNKWTRCQRVWFDSHMSTVLVCLKWTTCEMFPEVHFWEPNISATYIKAKAHFPHMELKTKR